MQKQLAWLFAYLLVTGSPVMGQGGQTRYADLSLSSLFSSGWSSVGAADLLALQGGAHDPNKRGFTVQNVELSLMGAVDPFLRGEAHLIFQIDAEGESIFELEEAFLTTQTLPYGLQVKAGTYFTEFGRLNPQHPHSWSFVDQPVISTRLMGGDGLRGPGVRLSWLPLLPWYTELIVGLQNANGETAVSFLGTEDESIWGGLIVEREVAVPTDLLRSVRWLNSLSLGSATTVNLGLSGLWGPNRTGPGGKTNIYGGDIYLKWQPPANDQGWPFVTVQGELMYRSYVVADNELYAMYDILFDPRGTHTDFGGYAQLQWGFKRGWVAGVRAEQAGGPEDIIQKYFPIGHEERTRLGGNLTYYPSEFSKLRVQMNLDGAAFLEEDSAWSFWFQYEFLLGQHAGHKF